MPDAAPIVIAHRAASGYLPEHTLEGVAMAHAQGADFIEQDVVLTRDGVPVVLHDIQIDTVTDVAARFPDRRRPDGRFYALDLTLAEIKTLHVHERTAPGTDHPVFPGRFPLGAGSFRVPTLDEELELIGGLNRSTGRRVGIYPEIKQPAWHRAEGVEITPVVLDHLRRLGYAGRDAPCFVQCFEFPELRRLRRDLGHAGRLIYLVEARPAAGEPGLTTPEAWAEVAAVVNGVGPALAATLRLHPGGGPIEPTELAATARHHGLLVHPWTARADALPAGVAALDDLLAGLFDRARVDGVFIDQPDLGVAFLRRRRRERERAAARP